jgi:protein kinase-like protein
MPASWSDARSPTCARPARFVHAAPASFAVYKRHMALPEIGTEFAGYRIEELIGRGGMGIVYRAVQMRLDRRVALKLILPELASDASFRSRFERECRMAASLDHPNVIPIFEAGEVGGELFVSMRYVDGIDLGWLIAHHGRLEPYWAVRVVGQVAEALDVAHSHGLVHRDVKPANVLIEGAGPSGRVYLTDFGLAKRVSSKTGLTRTRQFVGTVDYTAPEQIQGEAVDYRADVYALGCLIHHVLTGHAPFERETDFAALWAHVNDAPPSPRVLVPDLPMALDGVLARALAKRPEDRFASAGDLASAATAAVEGRPVVISERTVARGDAIVARPPVRPTHPPTMVETGDQALPATPAGAGVRGSGSTVLDMPAPAAEPKRRESSALPAALVAVVAAIGAAGAFVAAGIGSGTDSVELTRSASVGMVELDFPGDWRRLARAPAIPGLHFIDPISYAPAGAPQGEALVAGRVDAGGPPLLPRGFLARLPEEPGRDDAVLLGEVPAYRYRDLRPKGFDRELTLFVSPTTRAVVTVACMAPRPRAKKFMPICEQSAGSLELTGEAKPFSLRPGGTYARTLQTTMKRLNRARRAGLPALRGARTNIAQAAGADQVAGAYGRAAATLAAAAHSPAARDANAAIVRAMNSAKVGWGRLAAAARLADRSGYGRARAAVGRAEDSVRAALRQLRRIGYDVP